MPSLLPARFRRPARTAAVDVMDGSGIGPIPGAVVYTKDQQRAAMYVSRIGFVRRSYEFTAWQAARCTLTVERTTGIGSDWQLVEPTEPLVWGTLDTFQGARASQADLVRMAVFHDDSIGECFLVLDDIGTPGTLPTWSVRAPEAVKPKKGTIGGRQVDGFLVMDAPGGKPEQGTAKWLPKSRVYRHWQPSSTYELLATSSLIGMLDDLDTYWTLSRMIRRIARSRLALAGFVWTPAEAHSKRSATNPKVSELDYEYAQATAQALNDLDDMNVSSVAPFLMKTPGTLPIPQHVDIPGLTAEQLAHLQDARTVVADALPLSTSSVMASEQGNHWNEWLADEDDIELIADRLARVCASLTRAVLRPTLQRLADAGVWTGDPAMYRVSFDADPIRRRPDNSANTLQAVDRVLISPAAARRELHFDEGDAPSDVEARQMLTIAALRSGRPTPGDRWTVPAAPVADTRPVGGMPELPAGPSEQTAALPVIDDRWLLTQGQ